MVLLERTKLNKHVIDQEDANQPSYRLIYNLSPVELKTLKTNIKTYLKSRFIQPSKFFADAFILFDKKLDSIFYL